MLNIDININQSIEYVILIKIQLQIHFVMFIRGRPGTPIDPAPVLLSGKPCSTSHSPASHALRVKFASQLLFERPCGVYCTGYRFCVRWFLKDHADLLGEELHISVLIGFLH